MRARVGNEVVSLLLTSTEGSSASTPDLARYEREWASRIELTCNRRRRSLRPAMFPFPTAARVRGILMRRAGAAFRLRADGPADACRRAGREAEP